jgi:DNA-binding MurR/RpiR family transcriptional regulator
VSVTLAPTPVLQSLRDAAARLDDVGQRLYSVIAADYPAALTRRPAQLLRSADARAEDLDRLLAAAGFADTVELRYRASREARRRLATPDLRFTVRAAGQPSTDHGDRSGLRRICAQEQEDLADTLNSLQANGALELAARAILTSRHRWIFGDLKSTGYAALMASDLTAALRDVTLISPSSASALAALSDATAADSLTVFSFRDYSELALRVTREFRAMGATVIALTDSYASPICEFADQVLPINTRSVAMTRSPTAVAAVGHVLASLAAAGAKGAARRIDRRKELARAIGCYHADGDDGASRAPIRSISR